MAEGEKERNNLVLVPIGISMGVELMGSGAGSQVASLRSQSGTVENAILASHDTSCESLPRCVREYCIVSPLCIAALSWPAESGRRACSRGGSIAAAASGTRTGRPPARRRAAAAAARCTLLPLSPLSSRPLSTYVPVRMARSASASAASQAVFATASST